MRDQAFVALQRALPTLALTGLAHRVAQSTNPRLSQWLIRQAIQAFDIDLTEAEDSRPQAYASFNAFFTRALQAQARPLAAEPALLSPVDGRISQLGAIRDGRIFQAKGLSYSVAELLASAAAARSYQNGCFITLYLAPADYHRIHMPARAQVASMRYQPGRLLAVNPPTVRTARRVFSRNERLICHCLGRGDSSPEQFAVVMVGALFVSGLETVFTGPITPPHGGPSRQFEPRAELARGAELGRFNYGSTVILLLPQTWSFQADLQPGQRVRMGQALGAPTA